MVYHKTVGIGRCSEKYVNRCEEKMANKNNQKNKINKAPLFLFYMAQGDVNLSNIYQVLREEKWSLEYWKEMQVLEIILTSNNTLDLEEVDSSSWSDSDLEFQKRWQIKRVFSVTGCQEDLSEVKDCFEKIMKSLGGFLCSDSDDFQPFILE